LVELIDWLQVHQWPGAVPDLDTIVNPKTWGQGSRQEESAIGRPFTVGSVGCVDGAHFGQGTSVEYVNLSSEVAEAREGEEPTLGVERNEVVW
jgi:hypothetical protein